jgi:PAS domain S-box-containing protein
MKGKTKEQLLNELAELRRRVDELEAAEAERKRAEEALKQSEGKFMTLAEQSPNMIFINNMDRVVYANKKAEEVMGYTREDFYSPDFDFLTLIAPEFVETVKSAFGKHMKREEIEPYEYTLITKDGKRIEAIITARLIDYEGEGAILGIVTDITERKRAEEALKHRIEQLDALSRASQAVTASLELDQVLAEIVSLASQVSASDYTSVVLVDESGNMGQSAENVPGMPAIKYRLRDNGLTSWIVRSHQAVIIGEIGENGAMPPDLGGGAPLTANPHIVEAGVKSVAGLPLMVKDRLLGVLYLHSLRPRAFHSQLPLLTAFANQAAIAIENARLHEALKQELAERKRTEEALRESEERYRSLFEGVPVGLYRTTPEGQILDANPALVQMLSYPDWETMVTLNAADIYVNPEDRLQEQTLLERDGVVLGFEAQLRRRDGKIILVKDTARLVRDGEGRVLYYEGSLEDITERKRTGEALRESETRYRALIESQIDLISRYRPDTILTFVNDAYCQFYGKTREELIGHSFLSMVAPEFHELILEETENMVKDPSPIEGEYLNYRQDGEECWIQWVVQGIVNENGRVVELQAVGRDVTERKRAEEALRESEDRYRDLVEHSQDLIYTHDLEGRILSVNQGAAKLLGYDQSVLLSKNVRDTLVPELRDEFDEYLATIRGHGMASGLMLIQTSTGERRIWEYSNTLRTEGVATPIVRGMAHDITERKRVERLLRALNRAALAMEQALTHEEIFAAVAEEFKKLGFSCMLFLTDDTQTKLFPKYLSYESKALRAAERLVGINHEGFSFPVEATDVFMEIIREKKVVFQRNVEESTRQVLPKPVRKLAGQIVKMLKVPKSIGAPLIVEDEVIGALTVQADDLTARDVPAITAFAHQVAAVWHKANLMQDLQRSLEELQRTQDQLVQARKMEAIGRLAGGVAHDFNNLLTAIIGYSELLLGELNPYDPRRGDVEEINKAADRAAVLTRQLLAFSRKQVLQPQVLDLNTTVSNMEKMLRRLIGEDIDLVTILDPALGQVKADPGQIDQVLMNLAVNARDAMPRGGKLTIETMNAYLDENYARQHVDVQPGSYVMLAVSDTGLGMDEETLSHLFEPFFTTKDVGQGTGLGLSTVYGIVKQSGGHLWVYSEPGQGTTFKVYLPRVEEAAEAAQRIQVPTESLQGREIVLLVEDADVVRDLARLVLLQRGYTVLEARDGEEAIQICEQHEGPVHLIVTDVVMPGGMSGRQLAERLATLRPEMKVLYMSGYTDNAIVHHGVLEPGMAFLQKPFAPEALARKVRETLDAP